DYNSSDANTPSQLFQNLYGDLSSENWNSILSLGYSQSVGKESQIALWTDRSQRSGRLTERYINLFAVGNDNYEVLGNPHLKPETNNQADLIYTFSREKVFVQANVFYAYLENYISGVIRPDIMPATMKSPGVRQMQNLGNAMKAGFESRVNWQVLPKLRSEMAVAYTYAEDLDTKQPLPEIFPLDFRWKLQADLSPVIIAVNYRYSAAQNRVADAFGELKTPDFSLFNVNIKYNVFRNASIDAEVNNVFDNAYAEHLNRTLSTDRNSRILERGRSFNLGFTYSF